MKTVIKITWSHIWDLGKCRVMGCYFRCQGIDYSVQQHLETIWYLGYLRISVQYHCRFLPGERYEKLSNWKKTLRN